MGKCKKYIIFCLGEFEGYKMARSEKEAVKLYVEERIERYKKEFGDKPTRAMIKDAYNNTNAYIDGWLF